MAGLNSSNAVTNLREEQDEMSAVSRISYLFKFTQQSILVVDESSDFGAVGRQYLGELELVNAALVSISQKMTDIQLRCRIVEQLAPNTIFDPEKPLADTVVNLLEQGSQPLTIVIENAQYLSNTMISELLSFPKQFKSLRPSSHCDLLLVGDESAHNKCHSIENSNGFDLVSICGDSGKLFVGQKTKPVETQKTKVSFISIFVVLLAILIAASVFMLVQTSENKNTYQAIKEMNTSVSSNPIEVNEPRVQLTPKTEVQAIEKASYEDIFNALVLDGLNRIESEVQVEMTNLSSVNSVDVSNETIAGPLKGTIDSNNAEKPIQSTESVKPYEYLLKVEQGVLIQFASLSNLKAVEKFANNLKSVIELNWYPKLISGKPYFVVISPIFKNREIAKSALDKLPTNVRSQGLWLKDVKVAKTELNAYLQSQQSDSSSLTLNQ